MTAAYATVSTVQLGTELVAAPSAKNKRVIQQLAVNAVVLLGYDIVGGS